MLNHKKTKREKKTCFTKRGVASIVHGCTKVSLTYKELHKANCMILPTIARRKKTANISVVAVGTEQKQDILAQAPNT